MAFNPAEEREGTKDAQRKSCLFRDLSEGRTVYLVIECCSEVFPFKSLQHLVCLFPQVIVGTDKTTDNIPSLVIQWERSKPFVLIFKKKKTGAAVGSMVEAHLAYA